jgi:hypothetical protein
MNQPLSDAAVELLGACRHSLRFAFGAPIGYPYAASRPDRDNPPPALFRRVQVAAPPPRRDGTDWETGLFVGREPFRPSRASQPWPEVQAEEGAAALGPPDPGSIVLDWWFSVPRVRETMTFPGKDQVFCFLSVPYWNPVRVPGETVTTHVDYFATHRLKFRKEPLGDWIAISFDAFWPPERDSADVIAHLGDCDAFCQA